MVPKKLPIKLPRRTMTNIELAKFVRLLKIPKFRGIYMKNSLPRRIKNKECGIINLDVVNGSGTHWTAYIKRENDVIYFDSVGDLRPPVELLRYFKSGNCKVVRYNRERFQGDGTYNCGQLCLKFLYANKSEI